MLSLTATELQRFMHCNGFLTLNAVKPFNETNELTDEGNCAHWFIEQMFKGKSEDPKTFVNTKAPNGVFITQDMVENCSTYLNDLKLTGQVEYDTSYSDLLYKIRGRCDYIQYENNVLTVSDLKYGWKIVEPEMNWTLFSHAVGYLIKNPQTVVDKFVFKIYQPRPLHPEGPVREWIINSKEFNALRTELFATLQNPSKNVVSGEHCYRCERLSQCPAAQIATMNAIDVSETAFNRSITNKNLSWMLDNLKRSEEMLKQAKQAYEDLALHRLKAGEKIKGFSIENSFGQNKWSSVVDENLIKAFSGIDITVKKLMTPHQAKQAGVSEDVIKCFTERPNNGFKIVKIDENKRAEKLFGKKGESKK